MDKLKPKKRPRPTQDECMEWLRINHPEVYIQAARERDWIWIKGSRDWVSLNLASLKAYGFRAKQEGTHRLSDGTDAVWYHSCQGTWRPTYKGKKRKARSKSMSKSDALEFAKLL
jgi:hypothetical protein